VLIEGGEEGGGSGVVAEGFAEVGETIDISRSEDEAAAELEGILAEFVLLVAGGAGALAALKIVAAKKMKQIGGTQVGNGVRLALFINEQRKGDAGLLAEKAGVVAVAEADGGEGSAFVPEDLLVFAQLRDMLAAKDSAVVAEKNDDGRPAFPQRTETDVAAVGVRENDFCELLAKSLLHGEHDWRADTSLSRLSQWPFNSR